MKASVTLRTLTIAIAGVGAVIALHGSRSSIGVLQTVVTEIGEVSEKPDSTETTDSVALPGYDETELDEVVIVQRQKLIKSDGATLTYNVSEDPDAGSSNILDILRKVPGVTVDGEENVKVNGQSSFKILMNGRDDPMLKGDIKTVLKSMPAGSILKIEVISEPGAKYEAEGVGGILNIVTNRNTDLSGFMTQLSGWVNGYQAGGNLNGRVKLGKVMLDATVTYNDGKVWPRRMESYRKLEYTGDSSYDRQEIDQSARSGWDYTGTNLNMSWEPDSLNLVTLAATYGYNSWFTRGEDTRTMILRDGVTDWSVHRNFIYPGKYNSAGGDFSYQHNFGRDSHSIVCSYSYYFARQHSSESYEMENLIGSVPESPYTSTRDKGTYNTHIAQVDYINKFDDKHMLEAGVKANINDSRSLNSTCYGMDSESAIEVSRLDTRQAKDIYAGYASYSGSFKKWNVKGGVRYEHTRMGLRYHLADLSGFTGHLNDWVPNAAVSYNLSTASALRFAYQMRISRPNLYQMNPYVQSVTPGQVSYGNPDLKSEKGHTFSLSYNNYEGAFSGGAKLTYRYVANSLENIMYMKDDLLVSTYTNGGKAHTAMLDLNASWNITTALQWSLYASGCYEYFKSRSELLSAKSCGWSTNISTDISYSFANNLRLNVNGSYWSPWRTITSKGTTSGYWYSIGAGKSFLKDNALTIRAYAASFLPTKRTNSYVQEDPSVRFSYRQMFRQWNVGLSVTFKLGGLKTSIKKTSAVMEKEDIGSGSGNKSK
ncbi:MAG: TonB-dependent receptor [Muribaculaceae bacterium]|nr:TonB-dependent receptor [Muribaculaceae bacterium]